MPLPREETTPPVTKMCLAMLYTRLGGLEQPGYPFEVFGRVDADGFVLGLDHPDVITVFERTQLLEALGLFEGSNGEVGVGKQKIPAVNVQPDVLVMNRARRPALADVRNRRA